MSKYHNEYGELTADGAGRLVRNVAIGVVGAVLLLIGGCQVKSHSVTVPQGTVGLKAKTIGTGAGNAPEILGPGWHFMGLGEHLVASYPVSERRYSYTKDTNDDGKENEELAFVDKNGLEVFGDMNIGVRIRPASASDLYVKTRSTFDQLLENQIRNDVRTAVARSAARLPVEQMLGGGHQVIAREAFAEVRNNWLKEGVDITRLEWSGAPRFPGVVTESIRTRAKADQDVAAANAQAAVAEANARVKVADAQGDADAMRIRGEALRTNPQILQQAAIQKWNGQLPKVTSGGAVPFVKID